MGTLTTNKPIKFFDIAKELRAYEELLIENAKENDGELLPEISATLEAWEKEFFGQLATKTDNTASFVKAIEAEALKMKNEKDFWARKQKSLENLSGKIKKFLTGFMQYEAKTIMEGEMYKIKLTNNGGVQPLVIMDQYAPQIIDESVTVILKTDGVPEQFIRTVQVLDTKALRQSLESGETFGFAHLIPRGQHVRIS
jgi:hypothetical protein